MAYPMIEADRLETVRLKAQFGDAIQKVKEFRGETFLAVDRDKIVEILRFLKEDPELEFDYFVECVGVDYSRWEFERDLKERFEVVYNLYSTKHSSRIFLKVGVDDGQTIPTAKEVYLGAEYPEKEIGDLFGIVFEGNQLEPGERFMMPDDWVGYPLRKEYPLGGEDVLFDRGDYGPAVEDVSMPHAGESFEGKTGSEDVSGR